MQNDFANILHFSSSIFHLSFESFVTAKHDPIN